MAFQDFSEVHENLIRKCPLAVMRGVVMYWFILEPINCQRPFHQPHAKHFLLLLAKPWTVLMPATPTSAWAPQS